MNLFPTIQSASSTADISGNLPLCREVAWDFDRNVPRWQGGEPVVVTGKDAVKVWIWKALKTPRARQDIYSMDYGCELESLIGQACSPALKEAEAPRYLRECLLVNPYITDVKNVKAEFSDGALTISGVAVTIYGEVDLNVDF